jgi:peptide/nickel transport system ATP-binding protein
LQAHLGLSRRDARERALALMKAVGIPAAEQRVDDYPHQLSGGMRQRVMIAMAMACAPKLLIADEPTTALDVTIQAQILALVRRLRDDTGMGVLLITHDLGVVAGMAKPCGRDVRRAGDGRGARARAVRRTAAPLHAVAAQVDSAHRRQGGTAAPDIGHHTAALAVSSRLPLSPAMPGCHRPVPHAGATARNPDRWPARALLARPRDRPGLDATMSNRTASARLLEVEDLAVQFPVGHKAFGKPRPMLRAVDGVSLHIDAGETLGVVGESGCGKTTLGRAILRLLAPSSGTIRFDGQDITHASGRAMAPVRTSLQAIFQDPFGSLNPRLRVRDIVGEPLRNLGWPRDRIEARVAEVMRIVGLPPEYATRYPHAFSGGQRQTHRHRARTGTLAAPDRLRRSGVRARCVDPGADTEPAEGCAGRVRRGLPVRVPQPGRGAPPVPSRRRDVPGAHRRTVGRTQPVLPRRCIPTRQP